MTARGVVKPVSLDGYIVRLNVGGDHMNVRRSRLKTMHSKNITDWSIGNLFGGVLDACVLKDQNGRIVIGESPTISKHLVCIWARNGVEDVQHHRWELLVSSLSMVNIYGAGALVIRTAWS